MLYMCPGMAPTSGEGRWISKGTQHKVDKTCLHGSVEEPLLPIVLTRPAACKLQSFFCQAACLAVLRDIYQAVQECEPGTLQVAPQKIPAVLCAS